MIGIKALLINLLFIIIPLIMVIAAIYECKTRGKKYLFIACLPITLLLLTSFIFIRQCHAIFSLSTLNTQDIKSIQIKDKIITDQKDLEKIVSALNKIQWFTSEHGDWSTEMAFIIKMRSGAEQSHQIALYNRTTGTVIILDRSSAKRTGFSSGYAFSVDLQQTLNELHALD